MEEAYEQKMSVAHVERVAEQISIAFDFPEWIPEDVRSSVLDHVAASIDDRVTEAVMDVWITNHGPRWKIDR